MTASPLSAIVLAAGKGSRMGSDLPKVLHEVGGRAMIHHVLDAGRAAGVGRFVVVVGHEAQRVRAELSGASDVDFAEQAEQLGTGHAAAVAEPFFAGAASGPDVLVLCGDMPLTRPETLRKILAAHREEGAAATLGTAVLDDPDGYGRVVRDADGRFDRIVEQKDADAATLAIREVNPSLYAFRAGDLFGELSKLSSDNAQGEYYLTDVPGQLKARGGSVALVPALAADEVIGINTKAHLAEVDRIFRRRSAGGRDVPDASSTPAPGADE
ncbi:sugar phosphate nucleotidyltransferase [Phycisphaera mikurensis]|uniref:Putative UDP-N-acetylglucosamine pyrophosphorylase n=1 Tax=Phycisphaera mikurensis (strain NBRC 102666 / KCTC 22515 / FYK2301M01) TaxID=1142394 RepID=I0IHQ4_PHYMF|nr:NTP transferase domain-containing protein [Phycisphaera mikurensis]MBB6441036.1 bifunctional UDP-N-acetylglucosamine pyrophosphorylase/glucosamine-1-phosphate N-acetyltransferase [Phycisphaera mikurensis]BAM04792.1 putative UDP-N-acetylglucosamine pyrophosphorylase [Phycisphaera mikurensis NBRC 102666]